MIPEIEKFCFIRYHVKDARQEFPLYRKGIDLQLAAKNSSIRIVKASIRSSQHLTLLLSEMQRDICIICRRLDNLYKRLLEVSRTMRYAEIMVVKEQEYKAASLTESAVEDFLAWRDKRKEFAEQFSDIQDKWRTYEREITEFMQS